MTTQKTKDIDIEQRINFLKRINFFNDFDDHELRQFLGVSKWLKLTKDTVIIKENTVERVFYILVKGTVSVFKSIDGGKRSLELTTLTTGDCFGEMALVMETRRTAGVITTTECYILQVEPEIIARSHVFLQLKFYKRFCEILVSRLIVANERVVKEGGALQELMADQEEAAVKKEVGSLSEHQGAMDISPLLPNISGTESVADKDSEIKQPFDFSILPAKKETPTRAAVRKKVQEMQELPIHPVIAREISHWVVGRSENIKRLADIISFDPVLSARVLQHANSPYYGRGRPISSIAHAMITIGIDGIRTIVLKSVEEARNLNPFGSSSLASSFWKHSVMVGKIAEFLKDIIRINSPIDVFLAGLLHDLGSLAIDRLSPDFYPNLKGRLDADGTIDIAQAEDEGVGVEHGTAGGWLAEKMGLPQAYVDVMRFHHTPESAKENVLVVALVHLADIFASLRGVSIGNVPPSINDPSISFAWFMIQEKHHLFKEVNIADFVQTFNRELSIMWNDMLTDIPF